MKIVFFGDSITDMSRLRDKDCRATGYGVGFVNSIAGTLKYEDPVKYDIINRGIAGNRTTDLYARIRKDVWNQNPDVVSILIGMAEQKLDGNTWHNYVFDENGKADLEKMAPVEKLDYAFVTSKFPVKVTDFTVRADALALQSSDHCPLLIEYCI